MHIAGVLEAQPGRDIDGPPLDWQTLPAEEFFLQGSHKPSGLSVALGIIKAGKDLLNFSSGGHLQKSPGG